MTLPALVTTFGVVLAVLMLAQIVLLWRLARMVASTAQLETRIGHFADALSLLTETSEAGFRAVADELNRRQADPVAPRARVSNARLKAAAKRGRSIPEIAAAESMSEGEVRLRLHLAEKARMAEGRTGSRRTRQEGADAVRA
ncbi:MAG TPA: hypothetical protein VIL35_01765 [Vicinamibacterales bacterium]